MAGWQGHSASSLAPVGSLTPGAQSCQARRTTAPSRRAAPRTAQDEVGGAQRSAGTCGRPCLPGSVRPLPAGPAQKSMWQLGRLQPQCVRRKSVNKPRTTSEIGSKSLPVLAQKVNYKRRTVPLLPPGEDGVRTKGGRRSRERKRGRGMVLADRRMEGPGCAGPAGEAGTHPTLRGLLLSTELPQPPTCPPES